MVRDQWLGTSGSGGYFPDGVITEIIFREMKNGVFIFEDFEPNVIKFKVFDQKNNTVIKCGDNSISIRNIKFDFIIYTGTNI